MKILNLYAGIGGNRKLWQNVEVTAVEKNSEVASIYKEFFPGDNVIVGDAHKYLLQHFREYDFIWTSPPCQSHSMMGFNGMKNFKKNGPGPRRKAFCYPDMRLYQEIIFLTHFCDCKWVVENTSSYYNPLIRPQEVYRHFFWANFLIPPIKVEHEGNLCKGSRKVLEDRYGFPLDKFKIETRKDQIIRNCVHPKLGLHILKCATNGGQTQLPLNLPSSPLQEI